MKWYRIISVLMISTVVSTTTGCSLLSLGEEDYACPGKSKGVSCASTREMYQATNNGSVPKPVSKQEVEEMAKKGEHVSTVKGVQDDKVVLMQQANVAGENTSTTIQYDDSGASVEQQITDNYVAPALPKKPIPIRTPSVVMRILVLPWQDSAGDLNVSGYIYTEIEPRRWVIGDEGVNAQENSLTIHSSIR
ncbi:MULTISPECIES: TraV family lipoprotein [Ruminobacter]|uniref:TraV family lipoprotein n=1 Tax=Ruminobacter TaxID=866 RepID=UPI0038668A2C